MNIIELTPPAVDPVELVDVYDHLRLTPIGDPPAHPHDRMLKRHMKTAREEIENITRRSLVERTLRLYHANFPATRGYYDWSWDPTRQDRIDRYYWGAGWLQLPRPPVLEIAAVSYYDADNVLRAIDPASYYIDASQDLPRLAFVSDYSWPTTYARNDAFVVDYRAGYAPGLGSPPDYLANIPESLKQAVMIQIELLYNRLDPKDYEKLEEGRDCLLSSYIVHTIT